MTLVLLPAWCLGAPPTSASQPAAQEPGQGATEAEARKLCERMIALGPRAAVSDVLRLAARRDTVGLECLQRLLGRLPAGRQREAASSAFSYYKNTDLELRAIEFLGKEAFRGVEQPRQLDAIAGLALFPVTGETQLLKIARSHPQHICRAAAVEPVLGSLARRADAQACRTLIQAASLSGGDRLGVEAALVSFRSKNARDVIIDELTRGGLSEAWRLLLLDHLASFRDKAARDSIGSHLDDRSEAVRRKAARLLGQGDAKEAIKRLRKLADTGNEQDVADAIAVLARGGSVDPDAAYQLYAFTRDQSPTLRMAAARALGQLPTRDSMKLLHRLLRDEDWRVQLVTLEALARLRQRDSIPRMIEALGATQGRVRVEIARQLRLFTGVDHGEAALRWRQWFEAEGASFRLPAAQVALAIENKRLQERGEEGRTATFYGMRVHSSRVCFVLDTSGSMSDSAGGRRTQTAGTRLAVAQDELKGALQQLLSSVRFNVITFADNVAEYKTELVDMNATQRKQAIVFARQFTAGGGTNLYGGLMRAFGDPEVDTIYLLTDGIPSAGLITSVAQIRTDMKRRNKNRMVVIHGIAVGVDSPLLKGLAKDSGGEYRLIE